MLTLEFVWMAVEFGDDVGTARAGRLSALMISAALDSSSAMFRTSHGDSYLLGHSINDSLQMCSRYDGEDTRIYHSQILCTPNS